MTLSIMLVLALVLGAEFVNGWTDAPNATASAVATKLLTPRHALWLAAGMNTLGLIPALIFGAPVAHTIGTGIISPHSVTLLAIAAAMLSVIGWGFIAARVGLPVSKSHALFAALAGVAFASGDPQAFVASGWIKIGYGVLISVAVASSFAWILGRLVLGTKLNEKIPKHAWRSMQVVTVMFVASMHAWNDGLKFVGVFALVLLLAHITSVFTVAPWIILLCALVMGAGTLCGGSRIVKRIGTDMVNGDYIPWQGVTSELVAAACIGAAAFGGLPMSTTHTVVSGMAGAQAARGSSYVHWKTVGKIAWGWVITMVFCSIVAAALLVLLKVFL